MKRLFAMILTALALLLSALTLHAAHAAPRSDVAKLTYYTDWGYMADGDYVYDGAASCSYDLPFGTLVYFPAVDRVVVCEDRGAYWYFGYGVTKVDVWAPYGRPWWLYSDYLDFEIVRWGWGG